MTSTPSHGPTRRALLSGAALCAGLGVGASLMPAPAILASARPVTVRRDLASLAPDDPILQILQRGVAEMKARSESNPLDPLGWHIYGAQHSIFCATNGFRMQVHYGWRFLPWHRAYILNLERKIRLLTGDADFAMPYWDWTRSPTIPAAFSEPRSPLFDTTRLQDADDVIPADFIELGPSMRGARFHQFGGLRRHPIDPQVEGVMEQGPHNNVHNWIGGNMASFDGAGFDPLFCTHHGQIDRLWEAWRRDNPNSDAADWLDDAFPFYAESGLVETTRTRDMLDAEALGYTYDRLSWSPTLTPETTPVYAGGGVELATIVADESTRAKISRLTAEPSAGRALLQYDRVQIPLHPLCHRLFLLAGEGAAATAHYAGTFTLLPIPDPNQGLEKQVSTQFEIPAETLPALLAELPLQVVAVPTSLKKRTIPTEPLRLSGVRLQIEL